jgi:hypothetical protein
MKRCIKCFSYAFNLYKEDIDQGDLCDVHYWKEKAMEAQQEQRSVSEQLGEPVAWMHVQGGYEEPSFRQLNDHELGHGWEQYPLYTTPYVPTGRQQRKPLTDEQIETIRQQPQHHKGEFDYEFDELSFARAIEAAHGIKEKNTNA